MSTPPSSTNFEATTPANNESTTSTSSFVTANNINSVSNIFSSTTSSTSRGSKGGSTLTSSLATSGAGTSSSGSEAKIMSRYGSYFLADECHKRVTTLEHSKRLAYLRKEAEMLDKTDWMYDSVEKLLGN